MESFFWVAFLFQGNKAQLNSSFFETHFRWMQNGANQTNKGENGVLGTFFGAYDAYDISVFENGVFSDSSFVSGIDGVDEAFSKFCVD